MREARAGRRFWTALLAITIAAAAWRAWRLEAPSLDNDEVWQVTHAEVDLREQWLRQDNFPPLYNWLVSFPVVAIGDYGARWFSLGCGALTIPMVGVLGRRLAGSGAGIASAALLAVSANHVLLSQHGRAYAPMVLVAALMIWLAWRLRESDRWTDWAAFVAAAWAMVATHYFGGLLALLLGGMLLIEKRGGARAIAAAIALVIACAPLVACLRADLVETDEFHHQVGFDAEAYAFGYLWLVTGNTLGPSVSQLREWISLGKKGHALAAMGPWAALAAAPVLVLAAAAWRRVRPGDRAWLATLLLAPPLLVLAAAPIVSTGYNYRYIVWMGVPLALVGGIGAVSRPRWLTTAAALVLAAVSVGATLNRRFDPVYAEHDFHAVAALVERLDATGQPPAVLAAPLHYGQGVLYGLPDDWPQQLATANPGAEQDWDESLPRFAELAGTRDEAWLVTQWFPIGHPQRPLCDALAERLDATLVERVSSTVMVYRFPTKSLANHRDSSGPGNDQ